MLIRVWGSRGSIPVSGREFMRYGGDTTCLEIRSKSGDIFILDAGTGIRRMGNDLIEDEHYAYHFLITHGHWDHLMGFPFFKPLYLDHVNIRIHRSPFPKKFIENMVTRLMTPPNFPIRPSELRARISYEDGHPSSFRIGSMVIEPVPISHPNMGSGYKFIEDGKVFVFLTDNELGYVHPGGLNYRDYVDFVRGADLLFHDAEYTPAEYEYKVLWGHSAYTEAVNLALDAGVRQLGLFHLNQERTDDQVDDMVYECRRMIAARGSLLDCFAVAADMIIEL